ncbi:MFS transporter [Streptococcus caprae]|uniref:MFS transporter n=1 Tax=Streptococcus caprae TaxID=1640501 RepID=A0ABV8CSU9_9STRE
MTTQHVTVSKETNGAVIATALLAFCGILSETAMNVTFSHLTEVFHLSLGSLQWITTAYLLAVAITMTTSAALKQNMKERTIFTLAFAFFVAGSIVAILTNQFWLMIVGRLMQGVGTGMAMPLMFNIIAERVPLERIGFYMGIGGLIIGLAPAFGPTYGGLMIANFPWQWIFIAVIPIAVLAYVIGFLFLENSRAEKQKRPFNFLSFIMLVFALSALLLATSSLEAGQMNWLYVVIFAVALAIFIILALKDANPFLDIRLLGNPLVLFGLLPFAIFQFVNLSVNFVIPNFLTMGLSVSSSMAGFSLLPGTLLGSVTVPFLGKLYDEKGPRLSLYAGNVIFFLSMVVMSLLTKSLVLWSIIVIYIVFTMGRNMAFNNTMAAVQSQLPREKSADITAIFQMIQQFAGAFGTAISAVLVESGGDVMTGSQHVFFLMTVLVVLNFIFYKLMFKQFSTK